MADDFSARYGDLISGNYDCVDRVVLNAWCPMGANPGGLRTWWRWMNGGSDDRLDSTHLMRMAGRFARRVKAWAAASGIPLIYCKAGERKHLIAGEFLETHAVTAGVFLILAAKAPAPVWKVHRSARGVITNIEKKREYVAWRGLPGHRRRAALSWTERTQKPMRPDYRVGTRQWYLVDGGLAHHVVHRACVDGARYEALEADVEPSRGACIA